MDGDSPERATEAITTVTPQNDDIDPAPAEFTTCYRTTVERTFRIAWRMARGDRRVAREATQDAYARILRDWNSHEHRAMEDIARYAAGVAIRAVADAHPDQIEYEAQDNVDKSVLDLLDRQPTERRAAAILFFLEDHEYAEIADILGITEPVARTHVERMRVLAKPLVDGGRHE